MSTDTSLYQWVSCLSRPSAWREISPNLYDASKFLTVKRKDETHLAFFMKLKDQNELWLGDFNWVQQMEVAIFSLFSNILQLIKFGLDHPLTPKSLDALNRNPQVYEPLTIQLPSITQNTSLLRCAVFSLSLMCCPLDLSLPLLNSKCYSELVSPEILLALGTKHQLPYCRFLGSYFSYFYAGQGSNHPLENQNPYIQSYAVDDCELWKIGIFSPIPLLEENKTHMVSQCPQKPSEILGCILACQQLECIIQLRYHVDVKANYITVEVGIDNVRCAVSPSEKFSEKLQPPEKLMCETERYFPSRVMISVVPQYKSDDGMSSLSVGQSSHNPTVQYSTANTLELSFQTPKELGIKASSAIASAHIINLWKFDMPATGVNGCFEWILYDPLTQLEITSSKPPAKRSFLSPSTWNKNRHKKPTSPFNNRGGVVFAADQYGQTHTWRMKKNLQGKILKWKIEGTVWLTYWPNEHATSFYHTTSHNFCEEIELHLVQPQSQ